ncbi:MAG: membrane protein insertion efficiency factor YidD [Candidatus Marinimicrobia bacterium]|nr:membrane protein insertion efficiency factor YidD [Candidatus Neomarinimicrobiota bacterium]
MKKFRAIVILIFIAIVTEVASSQNTPKWIGYWEKPLTLHRSELKNYQYPGFFQSSALVWIRIYQKGISSQDLPSCVFHPSCSRFAFGAIKQYGVFKGILLAGDRLLRCNPFAHKYYQFDGEKFSDPVNRYSIKKHK